MNREIRLLGGFRQTFGPGSILPILGSEFALKKLGSEMRQISRRHPRWGSPRIHDALQKRNGTHDIGGGVSQLGWSARQYGNQPLAAAPPRRLGDLH